MAGVTRLGFLAVAVVFHLVYVLSIFDVYFVSPIVSGMQLFQVERKAPDSKPPADRLVLFVGMMHPCLICSRAIASRMLLLTQTL
jgi:phosphatidylinositol glycan class N